MRIGKYSTREEALEAAQRGDRVAMLEMGDFARDEKEEFDWYLRAAEAGNARGAYLVASFYDRKYGERGTVEADDVKAFEWYKRAAQKHDLLGMLELGLLYGEGRGVERDDSKSFALLRKAYDRGLRTGDLLVELGRCYSEGRGVEQDLTKAFKLYWEWDGDEPEPYLEVARCYRFGRGVEANEMSAISYYSIAGANGAKEAFRELIEWRENMSDDGLTEEDKKCIEFARRHCLQDDEDD